ncbi:benzoate transporter [Campylobacter volucris]|uniref:benzoate transporter n=1 Tax=Campylobacter volucris TaxID=1031542 RepID=UPI0024415482|nr:benzoate transporter [Campylobacter volucris]
MNIKQAKYTKQELLKKILKTKNLFWTMWGKAIAKELYLEAFNAIPLEKHTKINMAEDVLLYYPMLNLTNNIFYLNKILYNYQVNNFSISNLKTLENIKKILLEQDDVVLLLKSIHNKYTFNLPLLVLIDYFLSIEKYKILNIETYFYPKFLIFFKKLKFKFYRLLPMS